MSLESVALLIELKILDFCRCDAVILVLFFVWLLRKCRRSKWNLNEFFVMKSLESVDLFLCVFMKVVEFFLCLMVIGAWKRWALWLGLMEHGQIQLMGVMLMMVVHTTGMRVVNSIFMLHISFSLHITSILQHTCVPVVDSADNFGDNTRESLRRRFEKLLVVRSVNPNRFCRNISKMNELDKKTQIIAETDCKGWKFTGKGNKKAFVPLDNFESFINFLIFNLLLIWIKRVELESFILLHNFAEFALMALAEGIWGWKWAY